MPTIEFRVKGAVAPFSTYGSLWKLPRRPMDQPLTESMVIQAGTVVRAEIDEGPHSYYFAFSGQDEDGEFSIIVAYAGSASPLETLTVKTGDHRPRYFSFEV